MGVRELGTGEGGGDIGGAALRLAGLGMCLRVAGGCGDGPHCSQTLAAQGGHWVKLRLTFPLNPDGFPLAGGGHLCCGLQSRGPAGSYAPAPAPRLLGGRVARCPTPHGPSSSSMSKGPSLMFPLQLNCSQSKTQTPNSLPSQLLPCACCLVDASCLLVFGSQPVSATSHLPSPSHDEPAQAALGSGTWGMSPKRLMELPPTWPLPHP